MQTGSKHLCSADFEHPSLPSSSKEIDSPTLRNVAALQFHNAQRFLGATDAIIFHEGMPQQTVFVALALCGINATCVGIVCIGKQPYTAALAEWGFELVCIGNIDMAGAWAVQRRWVCN
jgi:hypothetical protein